jgi:hypothetical protein
MGTYFSYPNFIVLILILLWSFSIYYIYKLRIFGPLDKLSFNIEAASVAIIFLIYLEQGYTDQIVGKEYFILIPIVISRIFFAYEKIIHKD